jgi:hypothetical protein
MATIPSVIKDTADIREKILKVWKLVDEKKISVAEARLHIGLARTILETLKVEIAAAHLASAQLPPVSFTGRIAALGISSRRQ